MIKLLTH